MGKKSWLRQHRQDHYVQKALQDGYRSRAAYKLLEIAKKYELFRRVETVLDLGAAPGGWSQVAAKSLGCDKMIIAVDRLEMEPIAGVDFILGDLQDAEVLATIKQTIGNKADAAKCCLVISDMAPNLTGIGLRDQANIEYTNLMVADVYQTFLKPGGHLLVKSFSGESAQNFIGKLRKEFEKVKSIKPASSRSHSSEFYILASRYKNQ